MAEPDRIRIRCSEELETRWDEFAAGYPTYADALRDVMDVYDGYPTLFRDRRP